MDLVRKATVAGQFYAGTKERLLQEIEESFLHDFGPGAIPHIDKMEKKLIGIIAPHAGYSCSGPIAAHAYSAIAKDGFADAFIILGPNHTGTGSGVALYPSGCWETPLGKIAIDHNLVKKLTGGIIDLDETAHKSRENSIEVQLPFLQYFGKEFSFAPISMTMQDFDTAMDVGEAMAHAIKEDGRRIVIIASSDFSHEGLAYGRTHPQEYCVNEYAEKQDKLAIEKILKMDPKGLINTVYNNNISMCGYGPVAAMLKASEILGAKHVELLKYGTSYDAYPDSSACVGYGALTIY